MRVVLAGLLGMLALAAAPARAQGYVPDGAVMLFAPGIETDGPYGDQPRVWQEYAELPCFAGRYPVIGSWIVAGEPAGLGIREDATPVTRDSSRFVPHYFD